MSAQKHVIAATLIGASLALTAPALAADTLKLAIGQRGLWDSSIAEAGSRPASSRNMALTCRCSTPRAAAKRCRW